MTSQIILKGNGYIKSLISDLKIKKLFVVHSGSYNCLSIKNEIETAGLECIYFGSIKPNPLYQDIRKAVLLFGKEQCDAILAIGGGSVIDTAKCIKMFCRMDNYTSYLEQKYIKSHEPLIAIPTTAGSGSESTRFAVIYLDGEKQSLCHEEILPEYAILIPELLKTLPFHQKKYTLLDALCQGIESWWSVNSTEESKVYSETAIEKLLQSMELYFSDDESSYENIMDGANFAGRAINIAQTTAPHAMCYKLTTLYGVPHGYAAAICLPSIWNYMYENMDRCVDSRGTEYIKKIFTDIAHSLGHSTVSQAIDGFSKMLERLGIYPPRDVSDNDITLLVASVNSTRLKNSPVSIDEKAIQTLYGRILWG